MGISHIEAVMFAASGGGAAVVAVTVCNGIYGGTVNKYLISVGNAR